MNRRHQGEHVAVSDCDRRHGAWKWAVSAVAIPLLLGCCTVLWSAWQFASEASAKSEDAQRTTAIVAEKLSNHLEAQRAGDARLERELTEIKTWLKASGERLAAEQQSQRDLILKLLKDGARP
jgi:hypothetical protein